MGKTPSDIYIYIYIYIYICIYICMYVSMHKCMPSVYLDIGDV